MIESCSNCRHKINCITELSEVNPDDWGDLWNEDGHCELYEEK